MVARPNLKLRFHDFTLSVLILCGEDLVLGMDTTVVKQNYKSG